MLNPLNIDLCAVPVVDVRDGGAVRHAIEAAARVRLLRDDCIAWFPPPARPLLPLLDGLARRWLTRSCSPYVAEVETIAQRLQMPGIWFLNGSYQWCCTSLARDEDDVPWLARTLDWPFPGLGRHVEVARMAGPAGEFWNITWPGYVGVLTAMAPGRFAAAINQAPLRRRTLRPWLRPYDIAANAVHTWRRVRHIPPDQLLRQVFETCGTFDEAVKRLETTPIARPVIYTIAGCRRGECCVMERTEDGCSIRYQETSAANDWLHSGAPWEARVAGDLTLVCQFAEAAANSRARREALAGWYGKLAHGSFSWVAPPILNRFTRLAVETCAANGTLRVQGYELEPGFELPRPVTFPCEITTLAAA